jgi:hypothetical protein
MLTEARLPLQVAVEPAEVHLAEAGKYHSLPAQDPHYRNRLVCVIPCKGGEYLPP